MAESTTNFPTMGTEMANATNVSGTPSNKTTAVPKGHSKSVDPTAGGKANRANVQERLGFVGAPQMNHSYAQAPEAAQTLRAVRVMPSAAGSRDFYLRRQYGQSS